MVTTNTAGRLPEEKFVFQVAKEPEYKEVKGGYMKWHFEFVCSAGSMKMSYFDNQLGELLTVLGCAEVRPKVFEWEPSDIVGLSFEAEVVEKMLPGGKTVCELKDYRSSDAPKAATTDPDNVKGPGDIVWEDD